MLWLIEEFYFRYGFVGVAWIAMRKLVALFLLAAAFDVAACECSNRWTPDEQFKNAAIVFVGRVERVHDRYTPLVKFEQRVRGWFGRESVPSYRHYCDDYGIEYTFVVSKAWKGVSSRRVTIVTGRGGGDCGFDFKTGVDYLVYAGPPGGDSCQTDICTRTREVTYATEDLESLKRHSTR